ncbi:hypothetical protein [Rhodohalobacter sulfatireducens]|uniref:Uncharacterized protein n=1 Tax=Rhodohalobacter sulfatireducens TaxID=2911366 RepID=A0ABS9KD90_9BACT|nr:hypothetical protein [Rhodohalobacter sulfatireducens]MCG2588816.1 hypothetical protein [Rhodohalobacter sulfatireducens]
MNKERDYIQDIAEIRSMMEKSSKFLSLSGWAGIMAGIYALTGAYIAYRFFDFYPDEISYSTPALTNVVSLALIILVVALLTAIFFSWRNANINGENIWNATSRRLLTQMAVPLFTGGILILILISKGLIGLIAPFTLLFYGLALYNAGNTTIFEVRLMGFVQIALGLFSSVFLEYSLIFWAVGFGLVHIIYGIYMHFRYER